MQRVTIAVFTAALFMLAACKTQIADPALRSTSMPTPNQNASSTPSSGDPRLDEYLKILFFEEGLQAVAARNANADTDWARTLRDANEQARQGNSQQAITTLRTLADNADLEIGLRLWAWNGLRELGVAPTDTAVYGYVIEVPIQDGGRAWVDTLAVYPDGRLRYINGQVGLARPFVWEVSDASQPINQQAIHTVELAQATLGVGRSIPAHLSNVPATPRITLLTFNGLYVIEFSNQTYTQDVRALYEAITQLFVTVTQTASGA